MCAMQIGSLVDLSFWGSSLAAFVKTGTPLIAELALRDPFGRVTGCREVKVLAHTFGNCLA